MIDGGGASMRRISFALLVAIVAIGCGDNKTGGKFPDAAIPIADGSIPIADGNTSNGDGGRTGPDAGCLSAAFTLSPASQTVTLDGTTVTPITITAMQGSTAIAGSRLSWSVARTDDTDPGTIAAGVLTPNPAAGGTVTVTASDGCGHSATATIAFNLVVTVGTPGNPGDWTGVPDTTAATAPTIVYPSDQTRFPRNIYRTLFQWRALTYTQFRLTFTGAGSTVTVYTDGVHPDCMGKTPAAGCFEADQATWSFIAASNAGSTVTWTVDGLDAAKNIHRAGPITIGFSKRDVTGAVFYWSTTSAGIRRAAIDDSTPEDYVDGKPGTMYAGPPADTVQCVACHYVSRSGKVLVAPTQSKLHNSLWIYDVTKTAPPSPRVQNIAMTMGHGFGAVSPDDSQVIAAWMGKMWTVNASDGTLIQNLNLGTLKATQPDWSPDNTQVVFADQDGDAPGNAKLQLLPYNSAAGTWGTPQLLVGPTAGLSNLFPFFSPKGDWVAYSMGKGGHGDLAAQLYLISSTPASPAAPIELVNANRIISNQTTTGQFENTMPTWAPPGDLDWIAFNSQREYGVVSPKGTQQIWVAAVDLTKAGTGVDPSYPAFRLQFQGLTENNHRAFWTLDVRKPPPTADAGVAPPADAGVCVAEGASCDPVFDTCCSANDVCDTTDNGQTYTCLRIIP
jgi:hypothetical protein